MAFVPAGASFRFRMAAFVGRITSLILRRLASAFTSSITGKAPVPVPIRSRRHFQGMASLGEIGVCPKAARYFLDGFFLRLRTWPRSITTSCSYVVPSMRIEPKENFSKRITHLSRVLYLRDDPRHQCGDIRCPRYGAIHCILPKAWL